MIMFTFLVAWYRRTKGFAVIAYKRDHYENKQKQTTNQSELTVCIESSECVQLSESVGGGRDNYAVTRAYGWKKYENYYKAWCAQTSLTYLFNTPYVNSGEGFFFAR